MSIQARRERERAERERLIVMAARELVEAEGWDAVTTRRLAERVEYSQPVLYSHFKGKDAIMAAVAVEGSADLAAELRAAGREAAPGQETLAEVSAAYLAFGERCPELYDVMFNRVLPLPWATPETPSALQECFAELCRAVRPMAGPGEEAVLAEVLWSCLHGLLTLTRNGRLPRQDHDRRLALLLSRLAG
ncbi:TetR/AcrR family transcriptional regulator [Actinocorallia sp. A-T 12471]|uniref:TetR/AcrR family transcriptional regulator n=1 Tax=Actinocorallia sp. A-T 12471 TaxID=3089813 RepID=UPI0029CC38BA|nr:TetR/AcrR family transcriptional regulator [Actinocorallia sp. A-T 12471]MDX6738184.1 TetR/AcrR family transcriptional regulator [Actinocorallia sp. A-T 12471]